MAITVRAAGGTTVTELSPLEANATIVDHCRSQRDPARNCTTNSNKCQLDVCAAELWLCVAQTSLEAAQSPGALILNNAAGAPLYEVQPQDPESQVALAHSAQLAVARSMAAVEEGLLGTGCADDDLRPLTYTSWRTTGANPVGTPQGAPAMEIFASTLAEALRVGELAAELGTSRMLGIAERDAAAIGDLGRAARLTWFDESLSRVLAAQAQVGGTSFGTVAAPTDWTLRSGQYADPVLRNVGIGVVPPCGGNCTRALQALRRSGAPYGQLVPPLGPTYDFSATPGQLTGVLPTVATNLNSLIAHDADTYVGTSADAFARSIGVSDGDLLQAVEHIRYQDIVFAPPTGVMLAQPIRISPSASGEQRFENDWDPTTMNGAVPPPAMHYLTRARLATLWTNSSAPTTGLSLRLPILRPERAYLLAYARALASEAMALTRVRSDGDAEAGLVSVLQQARMRRALDVEVCALTASDARVRVFGLDAEPDVEEFRIVKGTDNLRCAVHGVLAGQPCTSANLAGPNDPWKDVRAAGDPRTSRFYALQFDSVTITDEIYIVRLRPGATAGVGAYEAIAGFSAGTMTPGQCTTIPYDSMSYTEAARIFEFTEDARESTRDCADAPDRLPLEDEIIDDGDRYETSWRHHLRVASAAAEHADRLGQELITAGLRMDEESERRVDEIEALCGIHINVDPFATNQYRSVTSCIEADNSGCNSNETCLGGNACILNDVLGGPNTAQRAALEDCLGVGEGGANIPVVALGRHDLCLWRSRANPEQLCTGSNASCPYVRPAERECELPTGLSSSDYEVVVVSNDSPPRPMSPPDIGQVLGLIGTASPNGEPPPGTSLPGAQCSAEVLRAIDDLRSRRLSAEARATQLETIRQSRFFEYENIRSVAARIGWQGMVGNISSLRVDGGPMRDNEGRVIGRTGTDDGVPVSTVDGPDLWPCADLTTGAAGGPLRWRYVRCDVSVADRAEMNWRMGRAAVVLTAFTDNGLGNHLLPTLPYGTDASSMVHETVTPARLSSCDYSASTTAHYGGLDLSGEVYGALTGCANDDGIWHAANGAHVVYHPTNANGSVPGATTSVYTNSVRPIMFLNFGYQVADNDRVRAARIARRLWEGLGVGPGDNIGLGTNLTGHVSIDDSDIRNLVGTSGYDAAKVRLFFRALTRGDDWRTIYLSPGWDSAAGTTHLQHLTYLFNEPVMNLRQGLNDHWNAVHLFSGADRPLGPVQDGYGAYITRRDLLDAMELACYVSTLQPPPPDMLTDEDRPRVNSVQDAAQVAMFAERVASAFDGLARTQVVRDVPRDVVDRLTAENVNRSTSAGSASTDRVTGEYGRLLADLRVQLRTMGESPTRIASIVRSIGAETRIFERNGEILEKTVALEWLRLAVNLLNAAAACVSVSGDLSKSISGFTAIMCGIQMAIMALESVAAELRVGILNAERANEMDRWAERLSGLFDALDSERNSFLNAVDRVQTLSGQLRDARNAGRAALARAAFASSNAAGRQYATNTVMRRLYDINLQRYEEALSAARRSAAIARYAIEQRFGVNLETQQCAQLVDSPRTWANDVCTAGGVNYGELRDPNVTLDPNTIRQMFIGDYVRRLEQYVESYRFDYPYQSGEDLLVMSLRDDVVRATSTCPAPVGNWLGSSNDLRVGVLPAPDGSPGTDEGWQQRGCAGEPPYENCIAINEVEGPRYDAPMGVVPAPVHARAPGHAPRGFEITFAPNPAAPDPYVGDYQQSASYTQALILPAGVYRLSWYQREVTGSLDVDVRPAAGGVLTTSSASSADVRPLHDGWERRFRIVEVPSSMANDVFNVGVFPKEIPGSPIQSMRVAGLQLEHISGTATEEAWRANAVLTAERHGPGLFEATTAPGYAWVDDCFTGDPAAFRGAWQYNCAQLCSGGFSGHCNPGETPRQFCYWELPFSLDEDRLLARSGGFGGGFAFGNYNYRSGEVAVNVVGTGVVRCGEGSPSACYSTAGIPYSIMHTAPAASTIGGGRYSIRAHDGTLHPVDLFDGRIESARALAAERYLTNPLSSSDAALLSDYSRGELRGRPMTGNYRLLIWDTGDVNFPAIEDVQVLWRYRYFTRTGSAYACE